MTLSIDTATNSLVVMAAGPLFDEVKALAESLDASAGYGDSHGQGRAADQDQQQSDAAGPQVAVRKPLAAGRSQQ